MNSRSKLLVTVAAAAILLVVVYFLGVGRPTPTADRTSRLMDAEAPEAPEESAETAASLDAAHREPILPSETAVDQPVPPRAPASASAATPPIGPGRLVVSAIDSETRKPVGRFYVRASDGAKINELHSAVGKTTLSISLLPAVYDVLVGAQGYEPSALPAASVPAGTAVFLDPASLRAGDARIAVVVIGAGLLESGLRIELLGAGRRPCEKCSVGAKPSIPGSSGEDLAWARTDPCATCGYCWRCSVVPVPASGTATFQHLASGAYMLRLVNKQGLTIGNPATVALRPSETLPVELEYASLRMLRVELLDTDGQSFASEWSERVGARRSGDVDSATASPEPPVFDPIEFDCRFRSGSTWIAVSSFRVPEPAGRAVGQSSSAGKRVSEVARRWDLENRSRSLGPTSRPEERPPILEPSVLPAHVDADGLVCFESVPSQALTMELRCRSFTATVAVPRSPDTTLLRAQLTRANKVPSQGGADARAGLPTFREFDALLNR